MKSIFLSVNNLTLSTSELRALSLSQSYSYGQIRKRESASSLVKASDAISNSAALADRNSSLTLLGGETSFLTDINSEIIQSTLKCRHLRTALRFDIRLRDTIELRSLIKRFSCENKRLFDSRIILWQNHFMTDFSRIILWQILWHKDIQ